MTPEELSAAIAALTGDVRKIAGEIGYERRSVYVMMHGRIPIKPATAEKITELMRRRRDEIDAWLSSGDPNDMREGIVKILVDWRNSIGYYTRQVGHIEHLERPDSADEIAGRILALLQR